MSKLANDSLASQLKSLAGASTADLIGIAPGGAFTAEEFGELGTSFGDVKSVVVLAQHIVDPIQEMRFQSSDESPARLAMSFGDAMLRDACWRVVGLLRDAGFRAAIPRNMRYGAKEPGHHISYKKAAVLAGFGDIGRSSLLIHLEWGPWIRLRAVITNALLPPNAPIRFAPCTDCHNCLDACPNGALSESGLDIAVCDRHLRGVVRVSPLGHSNCEECMRACPVGVAPPRLSLRGPER